MFLRRTGLASAIVLTCAAAVHSQQPQQPRYVERVDVARLIVDARVVDDMGLPLLGLAAEDFRVEVDGLPARVESALWVGADPEGHRQSDEASGFGRTPPPEATELLPDAGAPGRLIVFLFQKDLHPSRIVGLMQMLNDSKGFVDSLTEDDRVAVLSFDSHLKIWLDFTNDRVRLRHVLERGILFENPPPIRQAPSVSLAARLSQADGRRAYGIEKGLLLIAEALEPLPGSKSLVLFGHGFGRFGAMGVTMEPDYDRARKALVSARTSVFSLDVTKADYHSLEAGLKLVSHETGGFFARTHLFPGQAMRRLAGALAGYYVLFVEKPHARLESHKLEVSLSRRNGTVLARSSYVE